MKILLLLVFPFFVYAQNSDKYYAKAIESLDRKNYTEANKQIDNAIALDSTNLEYRWIKSRVNLTSQSDRNNFITAIKNLEFILSNGGKSARVYNAIGIAERELGYQIKNFERPSEDNSFKDDNKFDEWKVINKKALQHLILASKYFEQAEIILKGSTNNADIYLNNDIEDLKNKLRQ
ncbi:hypothetical protein [Chryseobacterium sp.]|uniref:hypothetical protein n=1 Tax=Chryseobacterium sp. TaxID=1871047 RepID=UPI0028A14178|nr:hypothetical protein [Chryseobacterium sp.]